MGEICLKFDERERYDVKVEKIEDMSSSIFVDSYFQAYKELNIISSENVNEIDGNNIIAFLGERGSGKTSCMRSFLGSLKHLRENKFNLDDEELKKSLEDLSKINFELLNIVEPSFFSEKVNVLELVISNMFKNFRKKIEENGNENYEKKKELLQEFQKVFKNMKYMKCAEEYENSEIEELMDLSTSVCFKANLEELIKLYLEFFSKNRLIISIDDIDLNTKFAYSMIEDVRKYLSISNVIVILALKLEQLKMIIKKEYITENKDLLSKDSNENIYIRSDIENRVGKYLLKLLPYERRIFLKNPDSYDNVKILIGNKQISTQSKKFQERILNFIFQKTNILFLKPEYGVNKIIPTNLRELVGLIAILSKLKEPSEKNIKEVKEKNYNIFKDYLYTHVFKDKLGEEEQNIIKTFLSFSYNKKNSYIISVLELSNGRLRMNRERNASLINVIKKIREVENSTYYLPFFIKIVYSNLLYEAYHNKKKQNFCDILGENYLTDLYKYEIFSLKEEGLKLIENNKKIGILKLFLLKNNKDNEEKGKNMIFSLIAPFHNIIFNFETLDSVPYLKNFIFRNMEIYEQFYLFLENIEFKVKSDDIYTIWKDIKKFYCFDLKNFIKDLPNFIKERLEEDLNDFIVKLEEVSDEELYELRSFIEENNGKSKNRLSL